jgi:hypothetical protein
MDDPGPPSINVYGQKPFDNLGYPEYNTLSSGDSVTVVWIASSGGKTQAMFRSTIE